MIQVLDPLPILQSQPGSSHVTGGTWIGGGRRRPWCRGTIGFGRQLNGLVRVLVTLEQGGQILGQVFKQENVMDHAGSVDQGNGAGRVGNGSNRRTRIRRCISCCIGGGDHGEWKNIVCLRNPMTSLPKIVGRQGTGIAQGGGRRCCRGCRC